MMCGNAHERQGPQQLRQARACWVAGAEYPIAYDSFSLKLSTAFAGAGLNGSVTDRLAYQVKMGAEYDYLRKDSAYAGSSGLTDLERFGMSGESNRGVRAAGSLALHYRLNEGHRLIGSASVRGQAFDHDPLFGVLLGYQVSFQDCERVGLALSWGMLRDMRS